MSASVTLDCKKLPRLRLSPHFERIEYDFHYDENYLGSSCMIATLQETGLLIALDKLEFCSEISHQIFHVHSFRSIII